MSSAASDSGPEFISLSQRVERLDEDVRVLKAQVANLSAPPAAERVPPASQITPAQLQRAAELAEQLGFRVLKTELETDPDDPEYPFWVLDVEGEGTTRELIDRQLKWHGLLDVRTEFDPHPIRLFIIPTS